MDAQNDSRTPTGRVPARRITPQKKAAQKKASAAKPVRSVQQRPSRAKAPKPATSPVARPVEKSLPVEPSPVRLQHGPSDEQATSKRALSPTHLASLAEGREQGRDVKRYLAAIDARKPRRGRQRTVVSIERRLSKIEDDLVDANPLQRLHLLQERTDLQAELESSQSAGQESLAELEEAFVRSVKPYSVRKGITVQTWRKMNVPAAVLRRGGL